jgi:DNA-binding NarL/FixJ family response regulator
MSAPPCIPAPLRVVLIDAQPLFRTGLRLLLEAESDQMVVGEAGDGAAALELVRALAPDVVVMDVRTPRLDGVEATGRIVDATHGAARVLVLTSVDLDDHVLAALRAGASGVLRKDAPARELIAAIRSVAAGDAILAPSVTRRLLDRFASRLPADLPAPASLAQLTERELDVLRLVARGRSNAEIAAELFLSETTVKTHVGHALTKLDLRDRVQAVVFAYESGLVRPGTPTLGRIRG